MAFTDSADNAPLGDPGGQDTPTGGGGGAPPGGGPILSQLSQRPQPSAQGQGNMASGMNKLKLAAQMIQAALQDVPIGTPLHTAAINALRQITRHIQQTGPIGTQQTELQDMLRSTMKNSLMTQIMQRQPPGGGGAGGQPPMPSPPLPGV